MASFLEIFVCLKTAVRFMRDPDNCSFSSSYARTLLQDGRFIVIMLLTQEIEQHLREFLILKTHHIFLK